MVLDCVDIVVNSVYHPSDVNVKSLIMKIVEIKLRKIATKEQT